MDYRWLGRLGRSGCVLALSFLVLGCSRPGPSDDLKPLLEKYLHAWNTGDTTGLQEVVSAQFEMRMSPGFEPARGLDSLKKSIASMRRAYPDFYIHLNEVLYAPDAVTIRWTIRGTNSGPGPSPPTGKVIAVPGMSLIHTSEGKIVDEWVSSNDLLWAEQLGFALVDTSRGH